MLKAIHAGEDIVAARQKAIQVIEKMRGLRLANAAELVATAVEETLAYYGFPEEHWRRIRTNNPLERILREIRRRTRVVGSFPDGQSALNLAAAGCAISLAPLGRPNAICTVDGRGKRTVGQQNHQQREQERDGAPGR